MAVMLIALSLRMAAALFCEGYYHPDEHFMVLEEAHRIVFGYGIIPWEFVLGARSWFLPGVYSVILYIIKLAHIDSPASFGLIIRLFNIVASLGLVAGAFILARQFVERNTALMAAFFCAVWYLLIYYSTRTMLETLCLTIYLFPLAWAWKATGYDASPRYSFSAGLLLGLASMIRFQAFFFLPVVLILFLSLFAWLDL